MTTDPRPEEEPRRRRARGRGRLRRLWHRLVGRGRPHEDRDLEEELRFHIEMETQKNVDRGMEPDEARRRAVVEFGGMERFKEECRDQRRGSWLDMLTQDLHFALRTLRKNPGFATAAILTLALGIGANTAIFSVIYGVMLSPLPYHDGDELVLLNQAVPGMNRDSVQLSIKEVADYREETDSFAGLVEHHTMWFALLGRGEPERVQTGVVSANFFDVLGVQPLHGRTFADGDDELDAEAVLVLSHGYWQSSFGGDPDVVGEVFEMNDRPHTVVGILPPIPQFPTEVDVYMPTSACPFRAAGERQMHEDRGAFRNLNVFGRLAQDADVASASAEVAAVADRWARDYPDEYPPGSGFTARVLDLKAELTREAGPTLLVLLTTAGLVLLIACANVANLTLARVLRREREMAVRSALGAGRGRLLRQLVTESTLLSMIGGAVGVALAFLAMDVLVDFAARFSPRAVNIGIDPWVLAFALAISVLTGLAFGSIPALPARSDLNDALKDGNRGSDDGGKHRLRRLLVVAQVAVAFMLLIGAGLTLRSLDRLARVDPGFDDERVLTARLSLNWSEFDDMDAAHAFQDEVLRRINRHPQVRIAATSSKLPLSGQGPFTLDFMLEGRDPDETEMRPELDVATVSRGFFEALGVPVLQGRGFQITDDRDAAQVAVVNQTMASRFWPGESPIGQRISINDGADWITIVGIVGDTKVYGLDAPPTAMFYMPAEQQMGGQWLVVRTVGDPIAMARELKDVVYSVGDHSPLSDIETMAALRGDSMASPRLTAMLLGLFGILALAITVTGIAGVLAFSVSERTRELGIRMALGARRGRVLSMVLRQGLGLVAVGLLLGLGGALAFGRIMSGLLYETTPTDPLTYVAVAATLFGAAVIACLLPARRATAVDPVTALRAE